MKNFFIKNGEHAQQQNKPIKKVLFAGSAVVLILIIGILFWRGRSSLPSYEAHQIPVLFEELMPNVTHAQARANICGKMSGGFYGKICANEFDNISLHDDEKIIMLLSLFQTIADDFSVSDYDRYFLGHLLFASLPNGNSAATRMPDFLEKAGKFLTHIITPPVIAQTKSAQPMSMRDFDEQLARDFVSTLYDLPDGDNAWVINIMVSKYRWVDGKRQPIYSEQYTESFNPFPANPLVNDKDITYRFRSFMDSKSITINESNVPPPYQGTAGVMMAYSFNIKSWNSPPFGHDESTPEKKMQTRKNFSETVYDGTNHLDALFDMKMQLEESSNKVTRKRNAALEYRKNFNAKNRRVQTRPREQAPSPDQPSNLEDAYFGVNDGLMPRACEAILAKMPAWKRQTDSEGNIVPHGWEEFIKDGKNSSGVTDLGTCSTNIIFEERDREDVQISIVGFDVMRERNEEYQRLSKDTKYGDEYYIPTTRNEIYEKQKKDWRELERNRYAQKEKLTDIFKGGGVVSTYYFDSDKEIPDPSIDSHATILSGKCVVSFYGHSLPIRDGDLYEERVIGPHGRFLLKRQGRWSGLYGKYHYYELSYDGKGDFTGQKAINVHPGFDHGFEDLHQKMELLAPQIVEAIKPFCE